MSRLLSLILVLLAVSITSWPALAEKRVALVIGNDRYPGLPAHQQLQKAANDARLIGDTLARLGFEVIRGENLDRRAISERLDQLTQRLGPGDTAFFFFAGHGVTIGGGNYILPTDVPNVESGQEGLLARNAIGESDIVADLQARGVTVAVVVLDACRVNPFARPGVRAVGGERGLTRAQPVRGVFTIYSAGFGQTALDRLGDSDPSPNSVFTRVFAPALARPGLHLGDLTFEVREEVSRLAKTRGHDQRPAYYDETLGGRIYLAGRAPVAEPVAPVVAPPVLIDPDAAARRDFEFAERQNSREVWEEFLRKHPTGLHAAAARQRLALLIPAAPAAVPPSVTAPRTEAPAPSQLAVAAPPVQPAPPPAPVQPAVGVFPTAPGVTPLSPERERALKPKDTFKECDACPEVVVVPAGSFIMGSPASEKDRSSDEGPQRRVTFSRQFAVGKFAVTFDGWDACVADGGCNGHKPKEEGWGRGKRPVINVSWDDAKAYVAWLSRKTGRTYRLLSEAEREYVARAGTTTPFWWGSSISTSQANYGGYGTRSREKTMPVDSFQPNPWGLYQVHGNVWEWTEDCWKDSYAGAPTDGSARTTGECSHRVRRGGSWYDLSGSLRSATRDVRNKASYRDNIVGFRVARTLLAP